MDAINEPSAFAECLPSIGLTADEVPAVLACEAYSRRALRIARERLSELGDEPATATFALGSLGRLEASRESDLDLAFLFNPSSAASRPARGAGRSDSDLRFDGDTIDRAHAERSRRRVIEALTDVFDIPEKTFDQAVDLRSLTRNIGGRLDTNETLTYRALLLTEGAWLAGDGRAIKHAIFRAYADAQISRGRFLASLGNDLHRYYRTLCMDYRHKVEELDKSWAIRVLKLRHSRKLWHLANLALQCWTVDAIDDNAERDVALAAKIGWPSLLRLFGALEHFGAVELARAPFVCFDRFLAALGRAEVRDELACLDYERRRDSAIYCELHDNAAALDDAAGRVVDLLLARCRGYMLRFCIL